MSNSFKPLLFDSLNVGKRVKSSKKRFTWKFELDEHEHTIDFYVSKLSGKRKLLLDGDIKLEARRTASYGSYPLRIGRHSLLIYEVDDNIFELRVDNVSFESTYMRSRAQSDHRINNNFGSDMGEHRSDPFAQKSYDP